MKSLHVITDLQFGSTGKGLFAGYLANKLEPDTVVSAWGPNAGHTFINELGRKYIHTMVPNGIVSPRLRRVLIGPGSVINVASLTRELEEVGDHFPAGVILAIHESACVVQNRHVQEEATYGSAIGSTMKGTGAAMAEKITRRTPDRPIIARDTHELQHHVVSAEVYDELLDESGVVLVEGAQGFSLSINQGFYPHVTSRECTTHQILSDCGIPHVARHLDLTVYGVARTYPIRVANRYDGNGKQIGTSGPCYEDQFELEWTALNREPELTTVTKLPRRLFTFSGEQVRRAVRMNGVDKVFLNFVNYCRDGEQLHGIIRAIENYAPVEWLGWGPQVNDVKER